MSQPHSPQDVYDALVSTLADWSDYAEAAVGECLSVSETTVLANAAGRSVAALIAEITGHRPIFQDGRWMCPTCVEAHTVFVRASAPCLVLRRIYTKVHGTAAFEHTGAIQLITQEDLEPYVVPAAEELERMHNLPGPTARAHAATVVRALARLRRPTRT